MQEEIPRCCGANMKKVVETAEFIEFMCEKCGDTVYVRKKLAKPVMLDD